MKEWFAEWFDSPYYHILYKHRDLSEAESFILNLIQHIQLDKNAKVLDLACGKGRHSIFLNQNKLHVTGVDLSENSINNAKAHETDTLKFEVKDMRDLDYKQEFEAIFNLFTSFGYFNSTNENVNVLKSVERALKPNGVMVLDYMNANKVMLNLVPQEEKLIDDILFKIKRRVEDGQIIKDIHFEAYGKSYAFQEKVQALTFTDFTQLFSETNLEIIEYFGNYNLDLFDPNQSDRLVIVAKKQS